MGRGVSSGGGQSSLGYLFGGNEAPAPRPAATNVEVPPRNSAPARNSAPTRNSAPPASAVVADKSSAVASSGGDAPSRFQLASRAARKTTTISALMVKTPATSSRIDHPPKSMLLQEVDLPWGNLFGDGK